MVFQGHPKNHLMGQHASQNNQDIRGLFKAIFVAGLVAGTLDIIAAMIQTLINNRTQLELFQFIASGVFGKKAFMGGLPFAFLGLLFHYVIAFSWTILLFLIYPKLKLHFVNIVITAVGYGVFVWLIMNQLVLPLSNAPPIPFSISRAVTAALILIGAIGVPLSLLVHRFYSRK
jgi:hypothetical protein